VNEPVRQQDLRVSDAERADVQERLRDAVGAGQLDLHEFDERAKTLWAAKTRGELDRLTADLPALPPPAPPAPAEPRQRIFSDDAGGLTLRVLSTLWVCALSINLVVWTLVALSSDEPTHFWPMWMLPSGAVLATLYAIGIGRPRRS
jgi:hypothetical protein